MRPDESGVSELELIVGRVLRLGVGVSSILLMLGLPLALVDVAGRLAAIVLTTAIIILLATPPARVVISVAEYIREGDWLFVALTLTVLVILALSVVAAFW